MANDFTHALNEGVAVIVGSDAALVFHRISYWMEHDEQRRERSHDYTKVNAAALSEKFSWLSEKQVRTCLKKLVDNDLIERAEDDNGAPLRLGRNKNDASGWYRKTLKSLALPNGQAGFPNGHPQLTKREAPAAQMGSSIKNNKPSNKPSNKEEGGIEGSNFGLPAKQDFQEAWKKYLPKFINVAGRAKVVPNGDRRAFIGACRRSKRSPEDVGAAILAFMRDDAKTATSAAYRKSLEKILEEDRYETYLTSRSQEGPRAYLDAVTIERREQEKFLAEAT